MEKTPAAKPKKPVSARGKLPHAVEGPSTGPTFADRFRAEDYASQHPAHAIVDVALGLRDSDPELSDVLEAVWLVLSDEADFVTERKKARAALLAAARRLLQVRDAKAPGQRFAGRTEIAVGHTRRDERVAAAKRLTAYVDVFLNTWLSATTIGGKSLTQGERHEQIAENARGLVSYVSHVGLSNREASSNQKAVLAIAVRNALEAGKLDCAKLLRLVLCAAGFTQTQIDNFPTLRS